MSTRASCDFDKKIGRAVFNGVTVAADICAELGLDAEPEFRVDALQHELERRGVQGLFAPGIAAGFGSYFAP